MSVEHESHQNSLESYIKTFGPKWGPEFYEEAQAKKEWRKVLKDITDRLAKRISPVVEGKEKFVLLATGHKPYASGYPEIDPTYHLRFVDVEEVIEAVQWRFKENEIAVIRKDIGRYRAGYPLETFWYAYSPQRSNPKSPSFRMAMNWDIIKRFLGKEAPPPKNES